MKAFTLTVTVALTLTFLGCQTEVTEDVAEQHATLVASNYQAYYADYFANRQRTARVPMSAMPGVTQDADGTWVVTGSNVTIKDRVFYNQRPGKYALIIRGANGVVVENCLVWGGGPLLPKGGSDDGSHGTAAPKKGWGIKIENSSNVRVHRNFFENIERVAVNVEGLRVGSSIPALNGIMIYKNRILNMQAWDVTNLHTDAAWPIKWESKGVQFMNVHGRGNLIWANRIVNLPSTSFSTDFINLFQSGGTPDSPMRVSSNTLVGAGPQGSYHLWGAGIQLGDHAAGVDGGADVIAEYNTLVYPGAAGININGGTRFTLRHNTVVMSSSLFGYDMNCDIQPNVVGCNNHAPNHLPREATTTPWTAISANDYAGGSVSASHEVSFNKVSCPACSVPSYFAPTSGVNAHDNTWQASLDAASVARPEGFFAFAPPTATDP